MCGIAGIAAINFNIERARLEQMGDAIWHRGPDDEGYHIEQGVGLVHRRLSIIDLSDNGHQPMVLANHGLTIVFNGEIFNYLEIKKELIALGVNFFSESDTEVILWAYRVWGKDCFEKFNGMWALAIWDSEKKELILSRDRFGVKPLYYTIIGNTLVFASEAKAIFASGLIKAEVNDPWMYQYTLIGYVDTGEESFFKDVFQFPAAHWGSWKDGRLSIERFWEFDLARVQSSYDYEDPVAQFRELLNDSVRLRLRSDVPVGSCLSGGLDSSTLVCIASNLLGIEKKMYTFSSIYEEYEYNEKPFVDEVVKYCATNAHYIYPKPEEAMSFSLLGTFSTERPCAGPTMISQLNVMREAHKHVKVLIDGQGSDEFLAGYHPFYFNYLNSLWNRMRRGGYSNHAPSYVNALFSIFRTKGGSPYALKHLELVLSGGKPSMNLRRMGSTFFSRLQRKELLPQTPSLVNPAFTTRIKEVGFPVPEFESPFEDELNNVLYQQFFRQSIPSLLITEDANSMAFSIEARTPFMDYRLVEFVFGLDMNFKIKGSTTKYIQREAMDSILPEKVRNRKDKKGYPTPYALWLRGRIKNEVEEVIFSKELADREIFDRNAIQYYWSMHQSGKHDFSWAIYKILSTELWFRIFIDGTAKPPLMNQRRTL